MRVQPPNRGTSGAGLRRRRRRAAADHVLADGCLLDGLSRGYDVPGFGRAAGGDEVFRDLVLARIIEPVSKLDSLLVLEEAWVAPRIAEVANRYKACMSSPVLMGGDLYSNSDLFLTDSVRSP
jgi:hypothetical protein